MSYGILLYNNNGKLIANTDDFNYGLVTEGTATCNSNWTTVSFSDTGEVPLIFIKFEYLTTGYADRFISIKEITTSSFTIGVFDNMSQPGHLIQKFGTVDYRIYKTFKSLGDISGQNWGMKIFNNLGDKTFDSRYEIPLITGAVTIPEVGTPTAYSVPASSVAISNNTPNPIWISINSIAGQKAIQYYENDPPPTDYNYECYGAVGIEYYGNQKYITATYGYEFAGSNQGIFNASWDAPKQVFLAKHARYYSAYFDGVDDYLTIASNSQLSPGTSHFTIEMWIYPTAYVGSNSLWDLFHKGRVPTADYEYAFGIDFDSSGTNGWLALYIGSQQDGSSWVRYRAPSTNSINLNTWYHIAVSKVGTTAYYLFNGSLVGTAIVDSNIPARGGALAIANNNIGTNPDYTGYISNVRFTVGQALYTSNYTVPTQPLTADGNTRLLTLQQTALSDASSNNFTITNPGNVVVSNFNPFD